MSYSNSPKLQIGAFFSYYTVGWGVRVGIKPQPSMEFRFFLFISPGITSNTEIDQAIVN